MEPNELTEALDIVGWSGRYLAQKAGCAPNTIEQMRLGLRRVPAEIAEYLRALIAWHEKHKFPAPEAWRVRIDLAPQTKRAPKRAPRRKASSKGR